MDSTLHATVCKHVHLVTIISNTVTEDIKPTKNCLEYFSTLLENKADNKDLTTLRQQVLGKLNDLSVIVTECCNIDALKTTSKHLNSALMTIKSIQKTSKKQTYLPMKRKIAPNKNADKQPRFFSTKKKTGRTTNRIAKPSHEEIKQSKGFS